MTPIRLATAEDGADLAAIYAPAVAGPTSFELEAPSGTEMAGRVTAAFPRWPWLVSETEDRVIGFAYGGAHRARAAYRWSVEVSVYVREGHRGAGVGRALYRSLFAVLALQGYATAVAGITLPNDASVRLHTAMGFTPVGVYRKVGFKDGVWHDVAWYERPLDDYPANPREPSPLDRLDPGALERALGAGSSPGAARTAR